MRPAWIDVDLCAYRSNLRAMMDHTGRPALAVVKANAYGHGLVPCARAAMAEGCAGVGVALAEEGAELRSSGFEGRILVLGLGLEEQAALLVEHDLEATVSRHEMLDALAAAATARGAEAKVHVKIDTGMTRAGVDPTEGLALCGAVRDYRHLQLAGVMTHFASADSEDTAFTRDQWNAFEPLLTEVAAWTPRPMLHAANSPAGVWFSPSWLDWVRVGILSYGVLPNPSRPLPFDITPVARVSARIVQIREVAAGRQVSYGGTWTAERPSRLALVPIGYADGLPWALSNRGSALVCGVRAPVRGRICMDQLVLDVTEIPGAGISTEAVFIGREGDAEITVAEVAGLAGTLTYEVLTRLSPRLPRRYSG